MAAWPNQPYIYVEGKAEIEKPADHGKRSAFDLITRNIDRAEGEPGGSDQGHQGFSPYSTVRKSPRNDVVAQDLTSEPGISGRRKFHAESRQAQSTTKSQGPFSVKVPGFNGFFFSKIGWTN